MNCSYTTWRLCWCQHGSWKGEAILPICSEIMYIFFLQENIVTVPNLLSLGRIVLSPVLGYLVISSNFSVALGLFAVAGLSDMVSIWQCNMSSDYWHAVYVGWWIYCEKLQRAVLNAGFSSWSFGWQVPSFYFVHYTCSHQVTSKWILIIIITEAVLIFLFL